MSLEISMEVSIKFFAEFFIEPFVEFLEFSIEVLRSCLGCSMEVAIDYCAYFLYICLSTYVHIHTRACIYIYIYIHLHVYSIHTYNCEKYGPKPNPSHFLKPKTSAGSPAERPAA